MLRLSQFWMKIEFRNKMPNKNTRGGRGINTNPKFDPTVKRSIRIRFERFLRGLKEENEGFQTAQKLSKTVKYWSLHGGVKIAVGITTTAAPCNAFLRSVFFRRMVQMTPIASPAYLHVRTRDGRSRCAPLAPCGSCGARDPARPRPATAGSWGPDAGSRPERTQENRAWRPRDDWTLRESTELLQNKNPLMKNNLRDSHDFELRTSFGEKWSIRI